MRRDDFFSDPARWVDALIIFVPITLVLEVVHADATAIFITAALGIVPLAGILGEATDALAHRAGARMGALLNATFGNAAELIITIAAIREGLLEVVKASITGSIIGNILLVLGLSVLAGGLKNGFQRFGRRSASVSVTMMTIAMIGLAIPAIFAQAIEARDHFAVEYLSIGVAVALMLGYALSLIYTFSARGEKTPDALKEAVTPDHTRWSARRALVVLAVSVVFIAALSEILVGAIEPVITARGLTELFVGVIIVPIIGNAAEHLVAVEMAIKNKMDLALGIALGSSMQIALFVAPLLVFISLLAGNPMSLVFNPFELAALAAAVVIAALIALDGESNWLEGAQLLIVYVILALAFFYLPV
jgi:Ca2+:H+ antiporter